MKRPVSDLLGKQLSKVELVHDKNSGTDEIIFTCEDGTEYRMYHEQVCCESVTIEDICGDLDDLVGLPIIAAAESSSYVGKRDDFESSTWTFYNLATAKGHVTLRWYGESNGYYSESADFREVT